MAILEFYTKVLNSIGCEVDADGLVSRDFGGIKTPLFVDKDNGPGKRLTLPTKDFLDNPDWDLLCPFHPLSESIVKGESLIIKEVKKLMYLRITEVTTQLALALLDIAVDKDKHKKLKPNQSEFLSLVPNVNEKTITALGKICHCFSMNGERRLVSVYLRRGGNLNDVNYKRLAVITFPITDELNKEERDIYDIKLTIAEKAAIKNIFYYLLPKADVTGAYNFGSNSDYAPNFHALCGAYIGVMKSLNKAILTFKDKTDISDLLTDLTWEEDHNDIFKYYNVIPPLTGNEGESVKSNEPISGQAIPNNMVVAPVQQQVMQPIQHIPVVPFNNPIQHAPIQTEVTEEGKVSWNSIVNRNPTLATPQYNPMNPNFQPVAPGGFAGYDRGVPVHQPYNNQFQQPGNFVNPGMMPGQSRI